MHVQTVLKIIADGKSGKKLKGYYHLVYKYAQFYGIANNPDVLCPWFMLAVTVSLAHNYDQGTVSNLMELYRDQCREYVDRYIHLVASAGDIVKLSEEHVSGDTASHEPSGEGASNGVGSEASEY